MKRVLLITSEWPSPECPEAVPFLVDQANSLRAAGVDVEVFSFRGRKNPARYLVAWFKLKRKLKERKYDLVHAHFGQSGLLALGSNIPWVVTFHGSDLQGIVNARGRYTFLGNLLRFISRVISRRSNANIVVSKRLQSFLPHDVVAEVIPCGINLSLFRPMEKNEARKKLKLPEDKKIVLFVGNPKNSVKRYELAKEAVSRLSPDLNASLIAVYGVSHEQMPFYMNACDVFLMTSRHEGSPMVIKEALACGLPIVSVDVGDVAEQLKNIEGCAVCENDSVEVISRSLAEVLKSPKPISGERVRCESNLEVIAGRITDIYEKITAHG